MKQKTIQKYLSLAKKLSTMPFLFLLVMPASTNYQLRDYGFGNGGAGNSSSSSYSLSAIAGELSGGKLSSAAYGIGSGLTFTNQADVPPAPTFTNPSSYYDKLHIVINTGGNPSDTKYAIAISTDSFTTTNYIKNDDTVVGTFSVANNYQSYTAWGGSSGFDVIGLTASTTYYIKVKAMQGKFTETAYSPVSSAATLSPSLTFSFAINTDSQSTPPFIVNFGTMNTGSVNTASNKIWANITTNATNGASVFIRGANAGLLSAGTGYKINSVTGDLNSLSEGFGAQGASVTQSSGGPLALDSIYNQSGNTVGIVDTTNREIFNSPAPITSGSGSFQLKAKPSTTANPASDYAETFTVIASGNF